jgi:Uncharacterized conserved protein
VNLPGHFICRYDDEEGIRVMVDPFNGGRLLTEDDCLRLAQEATGAVLPPVEALFAPAPKSRIIGRMLNNLHGAYWRRGDIDRRWKWRTGCAWPPADNSANRSQFPGVQ